MWIQIQIVRSEREFREETTVWKRNIYIYHFRKIDTEIRENKRTFEIKARQLSEEEAQSEDPRT